MAISYQGTITGQELNRRFATVWISSVFGSWALTSFTVAMYYHVHELSQILFHTGWLTAIGVFGFYLVRLKKKRAYYDVLEARIAFIPGLVFSPVVPTLYLILADSLKAPHANLPELMLGTSFFLVVCHFLFLKRSRSY